MNSTPAPQIHAQDADRRGSIWRRWEPHIHTPGTARNDQFGNSWDAYLTAIEKATPKIEALGVTDYLTIDNYEKVLEYKSKGRLAHVALIFPNVEFRFPVPTDSETPVNAHILFSPSSSDHVDRIKNFLRDLTFSNAGETYRCERSSLIRLGRALQPSKQDETAALQEGVDKFKVSIDVLRAALDSHAWVRENSLIGFAASSKDGTSGLTRKDSSMSGVRREIERLSKVVFSGNPKDAEFWAGRGVLDKAALDREYGGRKLCLHGSDAHSLEAVARPDQERYCWIKGDATFETLRQACLDPAERSRVGRDNPQKTLVHRLIRRVDTSDISWINGDELYLSEGLTAVVGGRGSGKTALADVIACASGTDPRKIGCDSFLKRGEGTLEGATVSVQWGDGRETRADLKELTKTEPEQGRVKYLSQQFLEHLCSVEGETSLVREVDRVAFASLDAAEQMGTSSMPDLLDLRQRDAQVNADTTRQTAAAKIAQLTDAYAAKQSLEGQQAEATRLRAEKKELANALEALRKERADVEPPDRTAARVELSRRENELQHLRSREARLASLAHRLDVELPEQLRLIKEGLDREFRAVGGASTETAPDFSISFVNDPGGIIEALRAQCRSDIDSLQSPGKATAGSNGNQGGSRDVRTLSLSELQEELATVAQLDAERAVRVEAIESVTRNLNGVTQSLSSADNSIAVAEQRVAEISNLWDEIERLTAKFIDALSQASRAIESCYSALNLRLSSEMHTTTGGLEIDVSLGFNLMQWAEGVEALLDARTGPFRGRGVFGDRAGEELRGLDLSGSSVVAAESIISFIRQNFDDLLSSLRQIRSHTSNEAQGNAINQVVSSIFDRKSYTLGINLKYKDVELEKLSPGTRGVVLLLLYIALDSTDDRPLLIDQPEDNLDPESIVGEVLEHLKSTSRQRQVLIVTHNANLVVNSCVDQVIVASASPNSSGMMPLMSYKSGALENPSIREKVCSILEGGREAFEGRAKLLRIRL